MTPELAEIRQIARRTHEAVVAKIHEPLRPAHKRRPPIEKHLLQLTEALDQLGGLLQPPPKPTGRARRRVAVVRQKKTASAVQTWEPMLALSRDPGQREQEVTGCKMLLLEIVRRAAYDWVLYRTSSRLVQKVLAEQAYTWIFVEAPPHRDWNERIMEGKELTSFSSICLHLDLQPDVVRAYIRRLQPKNVMSVGRPAEYRKHDGYPSESNTLGVSDRLVDHVFEQMAELEEEHT